MTQFASYEPPPAPVEGDRYKPIDHIGTVVIVKVLEHKTGIITENSPEGGPGVIVDLVDLADSETYRNVLWMGGAMVDGLKAYIGQVIVIKLESRKSRSGRSYPAPAAAEAADIKAATAYYTKNGDPFAPLLGTVDPDEPPF